MKKFILALLLITHFSAFSQEALPKFYTKIIGKNKVQISWFNPFESRCVQLSIQRSYDSVKFYTTIFTSLSPQLPQNGFVDNDYLPQLKNYYRIFYVLDDGSFFFSTPINPNNFNSSYTSSNITTTTTDSSIYVAGNVDIKLLDDISVTRDSTTKKIFSVYKRKTSHLAYVFNETEYKRFTDSITTNTKDTLLEMDNEITIWNPYTPPPAWRPSIYIFTNSKGNVVVHFDNYKTSKYKVIFSDALNNKLFTIKHINQPKIIIEKYNFIKAGWYFFELYENEKLLEKNKFLIESDF